MQLTFPENVIVDTKELLQGGTFSSDNLETLSIDRVGQSKGGEALIRQDEDSPLRVAGSILLGQDPPLAAGALQLVGVEAHHDVELLTKSELGEAEGMVIITIDVEGP